MTIYSIMPLETVMAGAGEQKFEYVEINLNGINMQVEMVGVNQAKIIRLLSCQPNDYLLPAYSPGSVIHFHPTLQS
jgi:hypothetical protein